MKKLLLVLGLILFVGASSLVFAEEEKVYIYVDKNSPLNNFVPSGWMGDTNDLQLNDSATDQVHSGSTALKITYTAKKKQGNGWAGIYWQSSQNNWGKKDTGRDLSGLNKLIFYAKGQKGGEVITKVVVGGITKNSNGDPVDYPDTATVEVGPIKLTNEWKEYVINLVDKDLSYINGGLGLIFNSDQVPGEQVAYIDDIYYTHEAELKKEAKQIKFPFYVYADSKALENHFIPSGWMPSTAAQDIKINADWKNYPFSGDSCIRIEYKNSSGTGWAGVYWQHPANNWGTIPNAGFNLKGAKKLTFWARGEKGGEIINEFKMGGISGEFADSSTASLVSVQLTKEWQKFEIDLAGADIDLSYIIGGFCWSTSIEVNAPEGIVFYLDEIKYEE